MRNIYWRTNFWYKTARFFAKFPITHKFNYKAKKCTIKAPFIVLCNHTTDYDALLIASTFKEPIHFVMSDHVSSIPVVGKVIKHLVSPIPITKSTLDAATVKNMMRVCKNGGALGLFPEGNKSFSGGMSTIKPSITKLLKKLNIPVVLFTIEGGYFTTPRWTKLKRKGYTEGKVKRIIKPEELDSISNEDLYSVITSELNVNAYDVQRKKQADFVCKDLAKHIESLLYMCPTCKNLASIYGEYNHVKCHNCDLIGEFDNRGYIIGTPFNRLDEWDAWQKEQLKNLDYSKYKDTPLFDEQNFTVKVKHTKYKNDKLGKYDLKLFNDKLCLLPKSRGKDLIEIPLNQIIGYGIEGSNGMQLWTKDNKVYRIKNKPNISGLKYINTICAITNTPMKF